MLRHLKTIYGGFKMRAIEKNIIQVLEELKDANYMAWDIFSISVRDSIYKDRKTIQYKLWNNIIFEYNRKENTYYFSFCGYSTNTTKSRLNAIFNYFNLGGFYHKNYVIYWNNGSTKIEVDINKKYKIVFFAEHAVKIEAVNE